ncbi:MAG: hypothetical protein RI958_864 [Actinomycetota bacterium]|jgi:4-aminobutyrate aminotransferase-like enzyme/Ser/Thr protein kinase RdoA (MazF antagonist)
MEQPHIDPVLIAPRPDCSTSDACAIGERFGIAAASATDLGSERDRTFMLCADDGTRLAVLKVSNAAESVDTLDMEASAVAHAAAADPTLALIHPWPGPDGNGRLAHDLHGTRHWTRVYDVVAGNGRHDPTTLDETALVAWGTTTARLARALRSFAHPNAIRTMPWDVQHATRCRSMLSTITDHEVRRTVAHVLDRFETHVVPAWPLIRSQVLHTDLTIDNTIVDDDGRILAIIDFGDLSHTALVADLASVLDSLGTRRTGDDLWRMSRLVLDGYQRITPLEQLELDLIDHVWAARAAVGIAIGSWRAAEGLEESAFAERFNQSAMVMLGELLGRAATSSPVSSSASPLTERRARVFGPAVESLSYDEPIHMASAEGTWMIDTDGRRYLDLYNNVPCIGHSHPRVTEAIARQARVLNTNLRYLHGSAIDLAERLVDSCPAPLDTVFFVNSGSEANDLAWRLATGFTGNGGGLCTMHAYHGISYALAPLSPEVLDDQHLPIHIERWWPTDTYRRLHADTSSFATALDRLASRGIAPAMTILDGVLQSDGVHDLDPSLVRNWVEMTHRAGGLWVADEVQGGHGRTGSMWSFDRFGIEPDIVTLGKPMGNGHPVAAVITRREIAERMAEHTVFFSTFGGNQVSVAAAHAVLDVLHDERVLPRVVQAGDALRSAARRIAEPFEWIGDVRGMGLANAIEVVTDRQTAAPDRARAVSLRNALRHEGVLVGTTGRDGNVLKVRPPLAFTADHVPVFERAFEAALLSTAARAQ